MSMYNTANLPTGGLPTLDVETLKAPKRRVETVEQAKALFESSSQADLKSQQVRTILQRELDGATPYDEAKLANVGQKHRTNVNLSRMFIAMQKVQASLQDVLSNPLLVQVKTNYGNEQTQRYWSDILTREITKTITEWDSYAFRIGYLLHNFAFFGLGVAYFTDAETWCFETGGLNEWLFPRATKPESSDIEVCFTNRVMRVPELMMQIEDEEEATLIGWNVETVKKICALEPRATPDPRRTYMEAERMNKNHDITYGDTVGTSIPVVHMFVQEMDGSISHAIFYRESAVTDSDDSPTKQFLYYRANAYESLDQVMVLFPISTSTNGYIHALRGIGSNLYPLTLSNSRLASQATDASMMNLAKTIQVSDQTQLMSQAVMPMGNYVVVRPDVKLESATTINIDNALGGTLAILNSSIQDQIGEFDIANDAQSRTEFEASLKLGQATRTTKSVNDVLIRHMTFLMRETVRRMVNPEMSESAKGYKEIKKLIRRLERKGVPLEAFYNIDVDETYASPAMGEGSPILREIKMKEAFNLLPYFPENGRNNLVRDRLVALLGVDNANRYFPPIENPAPDAQQTKQAMLENSSIQLQIEIPVLSEEDHETHGIVHAELINQLLQSGNESKEAMGQVAPVLQLLNAHLQQHLSYLEPRAESAPMYGQLKQVSQQADEMVNNGMKYLQAQERKQAEAPTGGDIQNQMESLEVQKKQLENAKLEQEIALKERSDKLDAEQADFVASQNIQTNPLA